VDGRRPDRHGAGRIARKIARRAEITKPSPAPVNPTSARIVRACAGSPRIRPALLATNALRGGRDRLAGGGIT
jgi:hypothetical protein